MALIKNKIVKSITLITDGDGNFSEVVVEKQIRMIDDVTGEPDSDIGTRTRNKQYGEAAQHDMADFPQGLKNKIKTFLAL